MIAIVVSLFHSHITTPLLEGALARLEERGISPESVAITRVPGAVELPWAAQQYARLDSVQVIICLAAVIRGETSHYDCVCQQVSAGCQQVMLSYNIPVIFGVLTTDNDEQALARVGGLHGHKGRDAADAAIDMLAVVKSFAVLKKQKGRA